MNFSTAASGVASEIIFSPPQNNLFFLLSVQSEAAAFVRDRMFDMYHDDSNVETNVGNFYVDYDADVKIPGRFYSKLPYKKPFLEDSPPFEVDVVEENTAGDILQHHNKRQSSALKEPFDRVLPSISRTAQGDILSRRTQNDIYDSQTFIDDLKDMPQGDSQMRSGEPYFDMTVPTNLSVQTGKTAVLACRVRNRDQKTVSTQKDQPSNNSKVFNIFL